MRICIISDLHANLEALSALPNDYEELWVLGDLVNYGPDPAATIDFVRSRASTIIRGNHDHSVGFGVDCGCSPRFRAMAEATREYTASVLSAADKQFLRGLSSCAWRQVDSTHFFLCHATPSDLLYEYRPPASPLWDREEEASLGANFVLVGHTHLQFSRTARQQTIVNPGSLGSQRQETQGHDMRSGRTADSNSARLITRLRRLLQRFISFLFLRRSSRISRPYCGQACS